MTTPVIDIRSLSKVYAQGTEAQVDALKQIDLRILPGEFVAIMGASGSGKSTLMNVLGCLDADYTGSYRCDGIDVRSLDKEALAKLRLGKIGFVFQSFNLLSRMDALHNVMMPLTYAGIPLSERQPMAETALQSVGLGGRMHHKPGELSGGQQQRIAIARALVNRPPMILADEPTGALDSKTGAEILALFESLKQQGHTIILITHDEHVAAHADRICHMLDGVLTEESAHVA
ncbi:ABC transporter ATP-binding protein [Arenimonas sp.]|jgi:putative ABC transport system ATP-binding protein|uniref:ABC transporter ATP-binding protein n=1 Tax=Arenimonas sp. TaxID=1872635 RepID=UPI0037BEBD22